MTDAELEELEAFQVKALCNVIGHLEDDRGEVHATVEDADLAEFLAICTRRVPSLISTIQELREENAQTKMGYDADIQALCEALWKREPGCEFIRLNYPQIATELEEQS